MVLATYNEVEKAAMLAYMINNMTGVKRRTFVDMMETINHCVDNIAKGNEISSTNGITVTKDYDFGGVKIYFDLN